MSNVKVTQMLSIMLLLGMGLVGCDPKVDNPTPAPTNGQVRAQLPLEAQIMAGKTIHEANCVSCHDSAVYSRPDRKVSSFPALVTQVWLCDANLSTRLFDEEIQQVAQYLNQTYYQFQP